MKFKNGADISISELTKNEPILYPLTGRANGKNKYIADYTLIDAWMVPEISKYSWNKSNTGYARRTRHRVSHTNGKLTLRMNRVVVEQAGVDIAGNLIDHRNHNKLDNRLENLRVCNPSQNQMNRKAQKNSTSGFKGVCSRQQWR